MRSRYIVVLALITALVAAACGESASEVDTTEAVVSASTETSDAPAPETTTTAQTTPTEGFIVQDGDAVEAHYVGTLDDGSQFDSSRDRGVPFAFTVGTGQVIGGFDEAVRGGKVGDVITVRIEPADAYGEWSEDNVFDVPFNAEQGDVKAGDEVFLTNGQPAVVVEVTEETVTLDTNHTLAGQALTFEIEILAVTRG